MGEQRVDKRAVGIARARVHNHADGLVDDEEVAVLVDDIKGDCLRLGGGRCHLGQGDGEGHALGQGRFLVEGFSIAFHQPCLAQTGDGGPGKLCDGG